MRVRRRGEKIQLLELCCTIVSTIALSRSHNRCVSIIIQTLHVRST